MSTIRREYKDNAIYRITIHLDERLSNMDGRVRAAREMAAVATRQPGFISMDIRRNDGRVSAFVILWSDLDAVDDWRSKIYEHALQRYGTEAWRAFSEMELETLENYTITTDDGIPAHRRWRGAAKHLMNVLSIARSA